MLVARPGDSRNGMAIVLVMSIILLLGFFTGTWFFLLRGESSGVNALAKHLVATTAGEAAAAQISAQIDRFSWTRRFHKVLGSARPDGSFALYFRDTDYPFFRDQMASLGRFGRTSWVRDEVPRFEGTIQDLPQAKSYRIKLKVTFSDTTVFMTWDKSHSRNFLGALNTTNDTVVTRSSAPDASDVDVMLNDIKAKARSQMGEDAALVNQIDQLIDDLRSGRDPEIYLVP